MVGVFHARSILAVNPLVGGDIYSFQNLMGVAFLGIWLIFSTIAAPVIIQKAVATGSFAASHLLSGAFAAGRTAVAPRPPPPARVGAHAFLVRPGVSLR